MVNVPDEAATAYQNAIRFDHDLVEAHYNYGVLLLEQNKADLAKAEFTTYTMRRPNDAAGWLEMGCRSIFAIDGDQLSPRQTIPEIVTAGIKERFGNSLASFSKAFASRP